MFPSLGGTSLVAKVPQWACPDLSLCLSTSYDNSTWCRCEHRYQWLSAPAHGSHTQIHTVAACAPLFPPHFANSVQSCRERLIFNVVPTADESFECAPLVFCCFFFYFQIVLLPHICDFPPFLWSSLARQWCSLPGVWNLLGMPMNCARCLCPDSCFHDVSACVSVCPVWSLSPSVLFTGNTQTSHPIARPPPRRLHPKGTDNVVLA